MALQRPVQLMWPREEDFTPRPVPADGAWCAPRAGLDANGYVAGWVVPQRVAVDPRRSAVSALGAKGDSQGYEALERAALQLRQPAASNGSATRRRSRSGFWRSVGASINTFAVESMIDELAAAAGQDPYQFRRARLDRPALDRGARSGRQRWATGAPPRRRHGARHRHRQRPSTASSPAVVEVSGTAATSFTRAARVAGDRLLPDGQPGQRRGAADRRRGARPQCHALRPADLHQRCGAAAQLQHQPHDPPERDAAR